MRSSQQRHHVHYVRSAAECGFSQVADGCVLESPQQPLVQQRGSCCRWWRCCEAAGMRAPSRHQWMAAAEGLTFRRQSRSCTVGSDPRQHPAHVSATRLTASCNLEHFRHGRAAMSFLCSASAPTRSCRRSLQSVGGGALHCLCPRTVAHDRLPGRSCTWPNMLERSSNRDERGEQLTHQALPDSFSQVFETVVAELYRVPL